MLTKSPRLNRKPNVYRKASEPKSLKTDMEAAAAEAYATTDMSTSEIERTYGVDKRRFKDVADEMGLDTSHRGDRTGRGADWVFRQPYFWDLIHELSTSPLAVSTIASKVGCGPDTARRYIEELGIERPEGAGSSVNTGRRLDGDTVREIRNGWEDFEGTKKAYAKRFDGVSYDQVVHILNRRTYKHVE